MRPGVRLLPLATAFLPGLLAGIQAAGLLFFLNPHLPFELGTVGRAVAAYGLPLSALSAAAILPFTWRRPRRAARALPWALSATFAVAGAVHGGHASWLAYYLPPGINERLLSAALWLGVAALAAFYTALLHSLHRRPYGRRSRIGFAALALATTYAVLERREAFRPRPEPAPLRTAVAGTPLPSLLVVGIDGATLEAVLPLAEQGELPFFARLLHEGAFGHLERLRPGRLGPLWTTAATGKYPYKHGILGPSTFSAGWVSPGERLDLLPAGLAWMRRGVLGGAARPVDARNRRASALWEVLPRLGVPSGVVGWPVSYPAAPVTALCLSDRFFSTATPAGEAFPPEVAARALRLGGAGAEQDEARGGGPATAAAGVRPALAGDRWRLAVAVDAVTARRDIRAWFVTLPGLAAVSRRYFGGFAAVEFEGSRNREATAAKAIVEDYYRWLDAALAALTAQLRGRHLLAVVSAVGAQPPGTGQRAWGAIRGRPVLEAGAGGPGLFLLAGEGVAAGSFLPRAELVDLAPTLIYALGLPIARDLDGRVLAEAFAPSLLDRRPMRFVPSYEALGEPLG